MRLLIFCPTYRLEPETVESIFAQEGIGAADRWFARDNPYSDEDYGKANILHNYRKLRELVLASYDAALVVESDVIPPRDAAARLLRAGGDLAYGLYLFRRGNPYPVNVFRYVKAKEPDQPLTAYPKEYAAAWGKVVRCSGSGLGCVLIHRRVFERVDFEPSDQHCDTGFTRAVYQAGFSMMADLGVVCGHKLPDGRICWPTKSGTPRWTTGIAEGYRGIIDRDPTERYERDLRAGWPVWRQLATEGDDVRVRVRLNWDYIGPTVTWRGGEIITVRGDTARRMIEGGGAEFVALEALDGR